jgi:hypothetical protein
MDPAQQVLHDMQTCWREPAALSHILSMVRQLPGAPDDADVDVECPRLLAQAQEALPHRAELRSVRELNPYECQLVLRHHRPPFARWRTAYHDRPVCATPRWEYGTQWNQGLQRELCYLKTWDLLTVDVDGSLQTAFRFLHTRQLLGDAFCWRVHETRHGAHLFLLSHHMHHQSDLAQQLQHQIPGSDKLYARFSYLYGYKVRLSPKDDADWPVVRRTETWGRGQPSVDHADTYAELTRLLAQPDRVPDAGDMGFFTSYLELPRRPPFPCMQRDFTVLRYLMRARPYHPLTRSWATHCLRRPQRLVQAHARWYHAVDVSTRVEYLCFRNLRMLDLDTPPDDAFWEQLNAAGCWEVHQTQRGFHVFDLAQEHNYTDELDRLDMGEQDAFYAVFAAVRGYCVRLTDKTPEAQTVHYRQLGRLGPGNPVPALLDDVSMLNPFMDVTIK